MKAMLPSAWANNTHAVCHLPTGHDLLSSFVLDATCMLDPATSESRRMELEHRLLAKLPALRGAGLFEIFVPRSPALRAWLEDELALLDAADDVRTSLTG